MNEPPNNEAPQGRPRLPGYRPTVPPLRRMLLCPRARRYYRADYYYLAGLLVLVGFCVLMGDFWNLLWMGAFTAISVAAVVREARAHRVGYLMGLQAAVYAREAKEPLQAVRIVAGSMEMWDPAPGQIVHDMEIEDLERHANGGEAAA